jgi:Ca-activated chloride channel family protein
MTDAEVSPRSLDIARELRANGYTVSVLAVGTAEGAPIPESGGGFLTDRAGNVVVPQLVVSALRRLAEAGGGRFAQLTPDDRDLETLFPPRSSLVDASLAAEEQTYEADVWRDQGVWLAVLLLPLLALGFRRGWVAAWLVCFLLPTPRASAFEWRDLWVRSDQQGYEAMQEQRPDVAAELFKDPQWRAAAEYRTGDYNGSVATLSTLDTAETNYNRGNALARAGQLEPAIQAYDRAIDLNPRHEDAIYNRALVQELLEQQQQNQEQQNEQSSSDSKDQGSEYSADSGEQQEDGESDSEQNDGDSGDDSQRNAQQRGGEDQDDDSQNPAQGDEEQQADNEPEEGEQEADDQGQQQLAANGPEDVEQWASDQAAEQWLRRIPQDPGGLLRRKFLYQYQRLGVDQDGNYVWPGDEAAPW